VVDGQTGYVVADPSDPAAVADRIARLLDDPTGSARMGAAGRARAVADFSYDGLAARLGAALAAWEAGADA
jgi:glycosyltransferase involved in cell wall biosynthesis